MWINEVMSSNSADESYGLNLEWISAEEMDKECIVAVPSMSEVARLQDSSEYIEIQVTEEEVVSDDWQVVGEEIVSSEVWPAPASPVRTEEPPPPHQCQACGRRFAKRSSLASHVAAHRLHDPHSPPPPSDGKKTLKKKSKKRSEWSEQTPLLLVNSLSELECEVGGEGRLKLEDMLVRTDSGEDEEVEEDEDEVEEYEVRTTAAVSDEDRFPIIDPTRPYVCQHCGIGFAREKALVSHNLIHVGDSAFDCPHCHDMFPSRRLLDAHISDRHPKLKTGSGKKKRSKVVGTKRGEEDEGKGFHCDWCDASFSRYNQLKRHRRSHAMSGRDVSATDQGSLQEGVQVKEEVGSWECDPCGLGFGSEEALTLHYQIHHEQDQHLLEEESVFLHSCNTCNQQFNDISELHSHMKSKHKWGHVCDICGTAYRDAKALMKHLASHSDRTRFFPCSLCHKLFYDRGRLKKHVEAVHGGASSENSPAYPCTDCPERLKDGASLAAHRQARHGTGRLFPCTQCSKTFTSRSSQQIHIRVHTGEKPYGCRYCWKAFADGGTLRKHERIHTGEKPYVCPVCTKAFNQRVVLREHVRAHHSEGRGRSFECTVCGQSLPQSRDLVAHLVMHSDENTAKHRLPNTSTRKYSRRKELHPQPSAKSSHHSSSYLHNDASL